MNRRTTLITISFVFASVAAAVAQDPVKAAPQSYKLQFENDLVKVLRVHYAARSKVPIHDHSRSPAAYVYLSDSGPINFKHAGWEHPVLTRPAVKAGSFRLSPTRFDNETHEAENPGDLASSFLRIEFKYLPVAKTRVLGRFPREQLTAGALSKVHFDNEQVRVTRHVVPSGRELKFPGTPEPALLAILFAGAPTEGRKAEYEPGQTIWIDSGKERTIRNDTGAAVEFLKFDLKK